MKLQEIFDQLSYGELSQLSIGGGEAGEINKNNWARVLSHVNLGLMALYKRFNLKEGRLLVELKPELETYKLQSVHSVFNLRQVPPFNYILDSVDARFKDDILKIEQVLTGYGYELGLNNGADDYSVFTPSATVIRVHEDIVNGGLSLPDYLKTSNLTVVYRAAHPQILIPIGYFDPSRVEVELPPSHLDALLLFIAARVNTPTGMTNEHHAGNSYYAKYEAACLRLELDNLEVDQGSQPDRLRAKGWA